MPANMSDGKIRVTALFGAGASRGWMDPKLNMVTNQGTIRSITGQSGSAIVGVSGQGVGRLSYFYPHELQVHIDVATGTFSYPTGDGSVAFGRSSMYPNGFLPDAATGMFYKQGVDERPGIDGIQEFSR